MLNDRNLSEKTIDYHAYLMRVWREDGAQTWRISLQSTRTGARYGFADFQAAVNFIEDSFIQGDSNE